MTPAAARASAERYTRCAHACAAEVIHGYSTSFALATRLLPRQVRRDISSLYALVRVADEVVDGAAEGAGLDGRRTAVRDGEAAGHAGRGLALTLHRIAEEAVGLGAARGADDAGQTGDDLLLRGAEVDIERDEIGLDEGGVVSAVAHRGSFFLEGWQVVRGR